MTNPIDGIDYDLLDSLWQAIRRCAPEPAEKNPHYETMIPEGIDDEIKAEQPSSGKE